MKICERVLNPPTYSYSLLVLSAINPFPVTFSTLLHPSNPVPATFSTLSLTQNSRHFSLSTYPHPSNSHHTTFSPSHTLETPTTPHFPPIHTSQACHADSTHAKPPETPTTRHFPPSHTPETLIMTDFVDVFHAIFPCFFHAVML